MYEEFCTHKTSKSTLVVEMKPHRFGEGNGCSRSHRLEQRPLHSLGCMAFPLSYLSLIYSSHGWKQFGEHCPTPLVKCAQDGETQPLKARDFPNDTSFHFFYRKGNFEMQKVQRGSAW